MEARLEDGAHAAASTSIGRTERQHAASLMLERVRRGVVGLDATRTELPSDRHHRKIQYQSTTAQGLPMVTITLHVRQTRAGDKLVGAEIRRGRTDMRGHDSGYRRSARFTVRDGLFSGEAHIVNGIDSSAAAEDSDRYGAAYCVLLFLNELLGPRTA